MACDAELDKRKVLPEERDLYFVWRVLCTLDTGHDGPHRSSRGWRWTNKYAVDGGTAQYNAFAPEALPPPRVGRTPLPDVSDWVEYLDRLAAENMRLREALLTLEGWDMLTLRTDGKGFATHDAPWARNLIAEALGRDGGQRG